MNKDDRMSPVFEEGNPVAVCGEGCERWRGGLRKSCLGCADEMGLLREFSVVRACMPWVGMMVEDNDKLEKVVDKLVEKRRLDQIKIAELEAEPDKLSKLVVATKGSLSKARRMLSEKVEELGKANGTMVVLESDKRELWGKLKDVQEFVTEKKKYKKRLEQAEEAASVVPDMEERIFQLENIQRDLEKKLKTEGQKNKALTDRVLELERDK